MKTMKKMLMAHPWFSVFDETPEQKEAREKKEAEEAAAAAKKAADDEAAKVKKLADEAKKDGLLTQDQVNNLLADEKRKHQARTQTAIDELDALKAKASLSDSERTDLETRVETMKNELLTKEELAKKETDKLVKGHVKDVETLTGERDSWRHRFTESTIIRSITDAAVAHEAFVPKQIVALLRPDTRLIESLDDDGKPTGELLPKVEFADKDKDDKPSAEATRLEH